MSAPTTGALVGLALAAIWALTSFWWVLLAVVLATIGWVVGMVADGRLDLTRFLGHDSDGPSTVHRKEQ